MLFSMPVANMKLAMARLPWRQPASSVAAVPVTQFVSALTFGIGNQAHHVRDERDHSSFGSRRIAPLDRIEHGVMLRQAGGAALEPVGETDRGPKRRRHHIAELDVERIGRGLQ